MANRPYEHRTLRGFGDSKENIDRCLNCTKIRCTNCLSGVPLSKQKDNPAEYVSEKLIQRAISNGYFSMYCTCLVYALWKEGFTDKSISELIGCHHGTVYSIRKRNEFTSTYLGDTKKFAMFEELLPVVSADEVDIQKAVEICPNMIMYKGDQKVFKYKPWNEERCSKDALRMFHAAVYKLWKSGIAEEEIASILDVSRCRVEYARKRIGIRSLKGAKTQSDRYAHAQAYLEKIKELPEEWDPIVKEYEDRNWSTYQSNIRTSQ